MKVCVLSGRYPATRFASPANHVVYARLHGYHYIHCNWPTGAENPYFNKIRYVQAYYHLFDYIFWLDDDAFFIGAKNPLGSLLPTEPHFLSICRSPSNKELRTPVSSGQFAIRCSALGRRFIDDILRVDLADVSKWWKPEFGFFSKGDQDVIAYLLATTPEYESGCRYFEHEAFNSRLVDLESDSSKVFLVHFTGPERRKSSDYRKAQAVLGSDLSLLPAALLAETGVGPVKKVGFSRRLLRHAGRVAGPRWTGLAKSVGNRLGLTQRGEK